MSKLYIAYGSNLNLQQMQYRCPTAKLVGTGEIQDYELQFKGSARGAHATIAPSPGKSVPVAVWTLRRRDEGLLDCYEGYPHYYFKQTIPVKMQNKTIEGMAYIMDQKMDFGAPTRQYLETVRQGYRDCGLDSAVLEQAYKDSLELAQPRLEAQEGMQMC